MFSVIYARDLSIFESRQRKEAKWRIIDWKRGKRLVEGKGGEGSEQENITTDQNGRE